MNPQLFIAIQRPLRAASIIFNNLNQFKLEHIAAWGTSPPHAPPQVFLPFWIANSLRIAKSATTRPLEQFPWSTRCSLPSSRLHQADSNACLGGWEAGFPFSPVIYHKAVQSTWGLPRWNSGMEPACNAGDIEHAGLIPGSRRSPGGGKGNPLHHSYLGSPMDREA